MGISASSGPIITYGQGQTGSDFNAQAGPNLWYQSFGLLDPRQFATYIPGQSDASFVAGLFSGGGWLTSDYAPTALSTTSIVNSQSPAGAGGVTLVSASGSGVTVGQSVQRMDNGQMTPSTLLAIDGGTGRIPFGAAQTIQIWDPAKIVGRVLSYVAATGTPTLTVNGFDAYGQPLSESKATTSSPANGSKAFKYILSVTTSGAATGVSIGTTDTFGVPLVCPSWPYFDIYWNNALITATTGFTAALTPGPSTINSADVRGTYAVQSASDGTKRLIMFQAIPPSLIATPFGIAQFANAF